MKYINLLLLIAVVCLITLSVRADQDDEPLEPFEEPLDFSMHEEEPLKEMIDNLEHTKQMSDEEIETMDPEVQRQLNLNVTGEELADNPDRFPNPYKCKECGYVLAFEKFRYNHEDKDSYWFKGYSDWNVIRWKRKMPEDRNATCIQWEKPIGYIYNIDNAYNEKIRIPKTSITAPEIVQE